LTAAIVMTFERSQERNSAWPRSSSSLPPASSMPVNALMSAPAQNSAGFGEARTIARAPLASTSPHAFSSASMTVGESEFAGGLSSHRMATSSRVSSLTGAPS
jgi:hypothetical protein